MWRQMDEAYARPKWRSHICQMTLIMLKLVSEGITMHSISLLDQVEMQRRTGNTGKRCRQRLVTNRLPRCCLLIDFKFHSESAAMLHSPGRIVDIHRLLTAIKDQPESHGDRNILVVT